MTPEPSNSQADSFRPAPEIDPADYPPKATRRPPPPRALRILGLIFPLLLILAVIGYFAGRFYVHREMVAALAQIDGTITFPHAAPMIAGLNDPVTVARDARGVPHIHAATMDDLVFAQGFVTAQDRLWQMELLRRHGAGELAAVLGPSMLEHDRLQRILLLRATADRAIAALPGDQKHWLEVYARGVNASMIAQRAHPPLEFRALQYQPVPWTPRDSLLIALVMYQDLSTGFPAKLGREALAAKLPPQLIADLYPVGSWRDHPPGQPAPDLSAPQPEFQDIPLDESQSRMMRPARPGAPQPALSLPKDLDSQTWDSTSQRRDVGHPRTEVGATPRRFTPSADLISLQKTLALFRAPCTTCVSGSNGWAVAGSRTASGKPMLSNDMHLSLTVPGLWYEAALDADSTPTTPAFHAAGVTLPGTPFVIAGHNAHLAWGFTNLGADVQDLYIEHTRGTPSGAEYETPDGVWHPIRYHREVIHVRGAADVLLDVPLTHHGDADIPMISSIFPGETRSLSLRWTAYNRANVTSPFFAVDSATDWASMLAAFQDFGGPPENLMYADDQGHIGYHAIGRIPIRGDADNPASLSPVPTDAVAPDAQLHEWVGYIPFDQLPQAFDPPGGVLVTANARVTLDGYKYPITLNWMAPYRTERIYKLLETTPGKPLEPRTGLTSADMLAVQNDVFSELDQIVAERLVYAIDHTTGPLRSDQTLHQAADILRRWNGSVDANAAAPAIVDAARAAFWPMLLIPKLAPQLAPELAKGGDIGKNLPPGEAHDANLWQAYIWAGRSTVEEHLLTDAPAWWLPAGYATWQDFIAAVVARGLKDAHAPRNLGTWQYGRAFPVDIEHPIYSRSRLLQSLIAVPTGTGPRAVSGDSDTVRQIRSGSAPLGPSERFTADLSDPDRTTLNLVLGQSADPVSPWYMDQLSAWIAGTTYPLPFTPPEIQPTVTHTLTLMPQ